MKDYGPVLPLFERYIDRWNTSPTAKRIGDIESSAIIQGRAEQWQGVTIDQFMLDILMEYTDMLRQNPALLIDPQIKQEEFKAQMQEFLEEEALLLEEADALTEELKGYKLGKMDPRWHKADKKLKAVVSKFRMSGDDYHKNMPKFDK